MNNSRKTNLKLTENIAVQVPNTVSISEDILLQVSWKNDLLTYAWNYYVNSATWGPSTNCSKLLVSDTTNFFDQKAHFLKDVLVSKQYIPYLLDFDQLVYIHHANI